MIVGAHTGNRDPHPSELYAKLTFACASPTGPSCCGAIFAAANASPALPVEYIVETTAKCNLYCPMCPRETHKQPKEDMTDEIFERLVQGAARPAST